MTDVQTEAAIDQLIKYRLAPLRERIEALEGAAQPIDVVQHVAWLQQYIIGMDESNWKDMRLRAERQLEGLSVALSISRPLGKSGEGPC